MRKPNKFIMKYYHLENDIFFNQLFDTGGAIFTFNDKVTSSIWNHAFPYDIEGKNEDETLLNYKTFIQDAVSFFLSKGRQPAIYLDERYFSTKMLELLYKNKFERFDNEAWMRLKRVKKSALKTHKLNMVHIDDLSKANDFFNVVSICFSPQYSEEFTNDFDKIFGFKKIEHFSFYDEDGKSIGASSVYYDKETAHIHNISVLPEFRRHGYGTMIVKQTFDYIRQELKIKDIVLQCDG
ncbi:MAG: GNAT family N-acetyltransferase, partial [Clostridia bacterium]|nr:GNAT family N-acetyltransferase [Clostridia bacterium]